MEKNEVITAINNHLNSMIKLTSNYGDDEFQRGMNVAYQHVQRYIIKKFVQ